MQIQQTQPPSALVKGVAWAAYGAALVIGGLGMIFGLYIFIMGFAFGPGLAFFLSYVLLISGGYFYGTLRGVRSATPYAWYRWLPALLGVPILWYLLITTADSLRGF